MYGIDRTLTKEYILANVTQEEIFEKFLGVSVKYGTIFCSPLRKDDNPTCSFKKMPSGVILYRDWADEKALNCFDLVMKLCNCDFVSSLLYIEQALILNKKNIRYVEPKNKKSVTYKKSNKQIIQVELSKTFQPEVITYLTEYFITYQQTKLFNVFPIKKVWLNDKLIYQYNKNDPAIAYYFGKNENNQRWKIYFFKRRSRFRFLCNTNRINGWIQLPEKGKLLVITKSLKDVICLYRFGIPAIAMQNETTIPYDYIIKELQERFQNIVSLYDFDRTGVVNANKLKRLYKIPYLFFRKINNVKDFSDYLKEFGLEKTQRLINETLSKNNILF